MNTTANNYTLRACRIGRRAALALAALCAVWATLPRAAIAQATANSATGSTTYSNTKRQFKVGILLIDSTDLKDGRGPENPDPFVFYIADTRVDLKPQNWDLINPLAPQTVTDDVKARWDARMSSYGGSGYQLGQKVTKDMAAYWEVSLSKASLTDLLQFDLLFITNHRTVAFSPVDREKMRKLVDAGGIIWIEDCGNMRTQYKKSFFLDQLQYQGGNFGNGQGGPVVNQPAHPILNSPYKLSLTEIANLGDKNYGDYAMVSIDPATGATVAKAPNPETLINIVGNTAALDTNGVPLPYIAAGYYGSGAVISTSGDSGCDINDYAGGTNSGSGGNSGAFCGPNLQTAHGEDLKFLYNVVAWGGANTSFRRNNRRTASSFDAVGAPLITSFNFGSVYRPGDRVDSKAAPLLAGGILYVSGIDTDNGVPTVRSYDTQPFRDLDGDGNFDDGRPDISLGLPFDEIWRYQAGGGTTVHPSSPILGTVTVTNGASTAVQDRIFVTQADGAVVALVATPVNANGQLQPTTTVVFTAGGGNGTYDPAATHGVAPAPVFYENRLYVVEPNGLLMCFDARTGAELWRTFSSAPFPVHAVGAPTVGLSRQTSNTALANNSLGNTNDVMLYVPLEADQQNNGTFSGAIYAYWLGTRNEVQRGFNADTDGQAGKINTRVSGGTGTTLAQFYGMGDAPSFLKPVVRVYSPRYSGLATDPNSSVVRSTQEQYEAGNESADYTGTLDPATGQVTVTAIGSAPAPGPGSRLSQTTPREPDIWVSVDYDVTYITPAGTPARYNPGSNLGARVNRNLQVPNYFNELSGNGGNVNAGRPGGGLDTLALAPDDTLLYSATQKDKTLTNTGITPLTSVWALHEQEGGGSQLRWRFAFNAPRDAMGNYLPSGLSAQTAGQIAGTAVSDAAPIFTTLLFDPNWPATRTATTLLGSNGQKTQEFLDGFTIIGSPITTNDGVTYALARATSQVNGTVSVMMAFRTSPSITLTLPEPFDERGVITVSQVNALADPAANSSRPVSTSAVGSNPSNSLKLDADRGKIEITNFYVDGGVFSASQSFVVRYSPVGGGASKVAIISPLPPSAAGTYGLPVDATGKVDVSSGGFTPLLWYYVLPGEPLSPPTLVGDYLYYTMRKNVKGVPTQYVMAIDADPASKDGAIRVGFSEPIQNVVENLDGVALDTNHVRMAEALVGTGAANAALNNPSVAPPVGGQGTLAVNSGIGTYAYQDQTTLIADSKRLIEVGADSAATWTLDSTQLRLVVGGELPVFGPNGQVLNATTPTGRNASVSKALSRPQIVRKISNGDYLIADTGNNRVLRVDRGGAISWSLENLVDPYNILPGGDPTTLSGPTDVQYYTTPTLTNGAVSGYEIHYIVADPGNYRIVEVADYYDSRGRVIDAPNAAGTAGQHTVVWATLTQSTQGRRLRYQGIQRYLGTDPTGAYFGYPYIIAVVNNSVVSGASATSGTDFTGGALVSLTYQPYNTTLQVRSTTNGSLGVLPPALSWVYGQPNPPGNGSILAAADDLRIATTNGFNSAGPFDIKRLSKPTYFEQINLPKDPNNANSYALRPIYLICDSEGVYAVEATTDANGKAVRNVLWMFTQADYDQLNTVGDSVAGVRGRLSPIDALRNRGPAATLGQADPAFNANDIAGLPRFQPTSVKLLPNGNFLITNSYYGRSSLFESGQFAGEVFEVQMKAGVSLIAAPNFTARGGVPTSFSAPRIALGSFDPASATKPATLIPNRQVMGNPSSNTGLLQQPLFSDRP